MQNCEREVTLRRCFGECVKIRVNDQSNLIKGRIATTVPIYYVSSGTCPSSKVPLRLVDLDFHLIDVAGPPYASLPSPQTASRTGLSAFAQLARVSNTQTTLHATCVGKGRIYAMRPKKWSVRCCTRKAGIMADKCNRESNKAVIDRRLCPRCCRLWRCFKHTSFLVAIYAETLRASMIS